MQISLYLENLDNQVHNLSNFYNVINTISNSIISKNYWISKKFDKYIGECDKCWIILYWCLLLRGIFSLTIPLNNLVYAQDSSITNTPPVTSQNLNIAVASDWDVTKMPRKQRIISSQRTQSILLQEVILAIKDMEYAGLILLHASSPKQQYQWETMNIMILMVGKPGQ